jgi:hypothetical protein
LESLDYWRLCEQLSVPQAALLIAGEDPASNLEDMSACEPWNLPKGYLAARNALESAVSTGAIQATIRRQANTLWITLPLNGAKAYFDDGRTQAIDEIPIDWMATRLEVTSLRKWLLGRGFTQGFFFPTGVSEAEYLDQNDPSYAPKLAAAVKAWEALRAEPALLKGRSLNQHAAALGLTAEDGTPIVKAVEDIATVANWNTTGGAPRTPFYPIAPIDEPDPPF